MWSLRVRCSPTTNTWRRCRAETTVSWFAYGLLDICFYGCLGACFFQWYPHVYHRGFNPETHVYVGCTLDQAPVAPNLGNCCPCRSIWGCRLAARCSEASNPPWLAVAGVSHSNTLLVAPLERAVGGLLVVAGGIDVCCHTACYGHLSLVINILYS